MKKVHIESEGAYAIAYIYPGAGNAVLCESGSMAVMSGGMDVAVGTGPGGIGKALLRKFVGQESFFVGKYRALVEDAWVAVAPKFPGDIAVVEVTDQPLYVVPGSFLAGDEHIQENVRPGKLTTLMLREGITVLALEGEGQAVLATYGGVQSTNLADGQELIIDTGHIVAWDSSVQMHPGALGGPVVANLVGEGLVGKMIGPGRVWFQTRSEQGLRNWLFPERYQNQREN